MLEVTLPQRTTEISRFLLRGMYTDLGWSPTFRSLPIGTDPRFLPGDRSEGRRSERRVTETRSGPLPTPKSLDDGKSVPGRES